MTYSSPERVGSLAKRWKSGGVGRRRLPDGEKPSAAAAADLPVPLPVDDCDSTPLKPLVPVVLGAGTRRFRTSMTTATQRGNEQANYGDEATEGKAKEGRSIKLPSTHTTHYSHSHSLTTVTGEVHTRADDPKVERMDGESVSDKTAKNGMSSGKQQQQHGAVRLIYLSPAASGSRDGRR